METSNSINQVEKDKAAINTSSNKPKFIKDFHSNMMSDKINKNSFLDSLFIKGEKPTEKINQELEKGKSTNKPVRENYRSTKTDKYLGVKEKDISIEDLKSKFSSDYIILKHKRSSLESKISKEYCLDNKNILLLQTEISKLNENDLYKIIENEKSRKAFLKSFLGQDIIDSRIDNFPSFAPINKNEYFKRLKKVTGANAKKELKDAFVDFNRMVITDASLKILIETDFLTDSEKKEIVKCFIPEITLQTALELGFLSDTEVKNKKKEILEGYLDGIDGINSTDKDNYINKVKLKDITISTNDFLTKNGVLELADKVGFAKVEKDFEEFKEDIENKKELEGPKSFKEFKNYLIKEKISGAENLANGSILKISVKGENIFKEQYFTINENPNDKGGLLMSLIGNKASEESLTKINKEGETKESQKYYDLIDFLKNAKEQVNFNVFSEVGFEKLITDKEEFEVESNTLDKITENDLVNDDILKEKIKQELDDKFSLELDELEKEKKNLEIERKSIKDNDYLDSNERNKKIKELDIKINEIGILIDSKNVDLLNIRDDDNIEALVINKNFTDLIDKINTLDSNGYKLGLKVGIILETEKGTYEITGIDKLNQTISLNSINGIEPDVSYEAFFHAFKENKTNRIKKLNTFEELLEDNSWDKNYKVNDGNLIQKNVEFNGKNEDRVIDYLVSEKGDLMKIESIGNGNIEIIFGELNEGNQDKKTKITKNKISLENNSITLSLNEFNKIIKDNKFSPDWKVGKDYTIEQPEGYQNDITGKRMTRFWNKKSLKELYMSGTLLVDGIRAYFKKGNDINAAEFALKWASILPEEVEADFITQTEMRSAEAMDKELTALGKISSGKAFQRVLSWLKNKDTAPHKIEAGLMLAAKYGILYPKGLANYNGTFLWYEALGGKIGDELYESVKAKAEKSGLPFDEKELLISLLGAQSGGRLKPKRRSKFYKEFKGKIAGGFGEEEGDGYKDATDKRNIGDVIDGGMDEAESGTLPNALGWARRSVEKGGSLKEMNEIYFSLIFSGGLLNAPGKVLEELKDHWSRDGNSMILAAFGSDLGGQKIFNKTVVNLSKDMESIDPVKYKGMSEMAESIFNKSGKKSEKYKDKIKNARNFWNKYGNGLSRVLFMADGGKDDLEYAKTDKLIAFGKENKYKDYYNFTKGWSDQPTAFKKDYLQDAAGTSGATGISHYNIIKQHFKFTASQTFADIDTISIVWPKIWDDIISTKEKIERDPDNIDNYKGYLKNKLREISAGLLSTLGKKLYDSLSASDPAGKDLLSIGLDLSKFKDSSYEDVLNGNDGKGKIFDDAVNNVVNGNISGTDGLGNSVFGIKENTQNATNNIMYNPDEDNDYDPRFA